MQYCCNSTVATAGVLNVRAKRLRPQRAPRVPPKSGKTVSHQPCPPNVPPQSLAKLFLTSRAPPKSGKTVFSPVFGMVMVMVGDGWWCHMRSTNSALRADKIEIV